MDQIGGPRDHHPRKSFWARFSEQETGPQKVLVGLAGTVTAVATSFGGIYALTTIMSDDNPTVASDTTSTPEPTGGGDTGSTGSAGSPGPTEETEVPSQANASLAASMGITLRAGQTLVTQGSPEADALVHAFVDDPGGRTTLDVVIIPTSRDKSPSDIMSLWYNCQGLPEGQPPGEDLCDRVLLVFDDADPDPPQFNRPLRIEMKGIWADNRATGAGYGSTELEIFPVQASF